MFSNDLLKRYLKYFILIASVIVVVLGFLWSNFLYTRHQISLETLSEDMAESMEEEVKQKAQILRQRAEVIHEQESEDLIIDLKNQGATLRAALYDLYFEYELEGEKKEEEIRKAIEKIQSQQIYDVYFVSDNLIIGQIPENIFSLEEGINNQKSHLIYCDKSKSLNMEFYISVDQQSFIKKRMEENFKAFALWDEGMHILTKEGEVILPIQETVLAKDDFFYQEESSQTGFVFGYLIPHSQLQDRIDERRDLYSSFLDSHIWEIIGFLFIFIITSFVIYRMIISRLEDYYFALNEEILDAYRNKDTLSDNPKFQHFALGDSFDSILRESQINKEKDRQKIISLEEKLKKNKIEKLLLERKIRKLSELPYTKAILHNYTTESFSPKEIISKIHSKIDPQARMLIKGSNEFINNDKGLFKALVEEVFQLTQEENRSYAIEVFRDGGQILLYFTIYGLGLLEDEKMQELKNRAKLLEGVFLRHQTEEQTLHLVLSLNDIHRNEEK